MKNFFLIISFFSLSIHISAQDVYQWHGNNRDGKFEDTGLLKEWPEDGPEQIMEVSGIGKGYASVSIVNDIIYTTGLKDTFEMISAIDQNGEILWQTQYGNAWVASFTDARCTPTIIDGKAYVISGTGDVASIDTETGKLLWQVDAFEKYHGKHCYWGIAESPLITDNKIIFSAGGDSTTIVALDTSSGDLIWKTKSYQVMSVYASPMLINKNNKSQIISIVGDYVLGIEPESGNISWEFNYKDSLRSKKGYDLKCNTPLYKDDRIYITSGYNAVAFQLQLNEDWSAAHLAWQDSTLDSHHGGAVEIDGKIYGPSWISNKAGNWVCLDWETGAVAYEDSSWLSKGSIIAADNMLYCYEERKGMVALVKATPEKFDIKSQFRITKGEGPHWAHPVIHKGKLYIRHGDVLMGYRIKE